MSSLAVAESRAKVKSVRARKPPVPFHPILFGLYPPLALFALNLSLLPAQGALLAMSISLAGSVAIWLVLSAALRDPRRGAGGASILILAFYFYGPCLEAWNRGPGFLIWGPGRGDFDQIYGSLSIMLAAACAWKSRHVGTITDFLNVAGIVLCIGPVWTIARQEWAIRSQFRSASAAAVGIVSTTGTRPPDVFYIVLDGYGRADQLERVIGFSNEPFLSELRRRGFYIAERSRSNYSQTDLSICSSLNLDYNQNLLEPTGDASAEREVADRLIDRNRLVEALRPFGYKYVAITTGAPSLRFSSADLALEATTGQAIYFETLIAKTPLASYAETQKEAYNVRRWRLIRAGFDALDASSVPRAAPRLVVMHVMAPHPSFVLDENGSFVRRVGPAGLWDSNDFMSRGGTEEQYRKGYSGQLQYVNKRLLSAIDKIERLVPKPVVVLLGDHGSRMRFHHKDISKIDADEAFANLTAVSAPRPIAERLYPTITPVNIMRLILSAGFGQDLRLLPDRSYYSSWDDPLKFTDVTDRLH